MKNTLKFNNQYIESRKNKIDIVSKNWDINKLANFFSDNYNIDSQTDKDIIKPFTRDWSNIPDGNAELLVRPQSNEECAIILNICQMCKIPITISAGQTNLTGSATPKSGLLISTELMISPQSKINIQAKTVQVPIGEILENVRDKVFSDSNSKLYYTVDPTSRKDAQVGGTISCNASGFIPGEQGATRCWVEGLEMILPNGKLINCKLLL